MLDLQDTENEYNREEQDYWLDRFLIRTIVLIDNHTHLYIHHSDLLHFELWHIEHLEDREIVHNNKWPRFLEYRFHLYSLNLAYNHTDLHIAGRALIVWNLLDFDLEN
jgi:hypothetical protein